MSTPHQEDKPSPTKGEHVSSSLTSSEQTEDMNPRFPLRAPIKFGSFDVTSQVFHTTPHTFALVNLKPLLPGHILVCPYQSPSNNAPTSPSRLLHLPASTTSTLLPHITLLLPTLTRLYHADGFNIAIQDGSAAGQSVAHVHVHVIPRREHDLDARGGGDKIYEMMEGPEGDLGARLREMRAGVGEKGKTKGAFTGPDLKDEERKPRSEEEMRSEAEWLRRELERDGVVST